MSTTWVFKQANIGIACEQAHDWATKKKESRESQGRYREEKMAASFSNPFFFFMFIDSLHFPNFFPLTRSLFTGFVEECCNPCL